MAIRTRVKPDDLTTIQDFVERKKLTKSEHNMMLYIIRVFQQKNKIRNELIGKRKFYVENDLRKIYREVMRITLN